jgi:hypothetical protein
MNSKFMGRLGLSDAEEDALVAFMQTLTDVFAAVLSLPGRNQSRAFRYRRVRRILMRTAVRPTYRTPRCLVHRPANERLSHGRSRPANKVG